MIPCTSYDYMDNVLRIVDNHVENRIPLETLKKISDNIKENSEQSFTINELTIIGLLNNEGAKLYLDDKSEQIRETVFQKIAGRKSRYYKHTGFLWNEGWKEYNTEPQGVFFKGKILSESEINFSLKMYRVCDVYDVLNWVAKAGAVVIAVVVGVNMVPTVAANIEGLIYYVKTFGIVQGLKMYTYLGIENVPTSVINSIQMEIADGDDDEYKLAKYADNVVKLDKDAWEMSPVKRGDYFDDLFGNNLGHNFPVVDKLENRVLTSIKSMDLSLKTYQKPNGIFGKILKDASTLKSFTGKSWANTEIFVGQYDKKVLQIILPNMSISAQQMMELQAAEIYIENEYNIQLILTVATK